MLFARRNLVILALAAGALVALGAVMVTRNAGSADSAIPPQSDGLDFKSHPLGPAGQEVPSLSAADELPFSVLLPDEEAGGEVQTVWIRTDESSGMAVRYDSGVTIVERVAESTDFPTRAYYQRLADGVPGASVTTINEAPAMVIDAGEKSGSPPSVDVILQGVQVSIYGIAGQGADELLALATTIDATGAGKPLHLK